MFMLIIVTEATVMVCKTHKLRLCVRQFEFGNWTEPTGKTSAL